MKKEIHITGDGSHTLFLPGINESYHSANGAYSESKHVYIELGLRGVSLNKSKIRILEIGLGTGLNCLLTYIESEKQNLAVYYDTLEPYPLDKDLIYKLNYSMITNYEGAGKIMEIIHSSPLSRWIDINKQFRLRKNIEKLQDVNLQPCNYDLVYYDAFGPKAQPGMWTPENFQKTYDSMKHGSMLVTYCAKGQVRRDMQAAGFVVEKLPGPPGKREVTRAMKIYPISDIPYY